MAEPRQITFSYPELAELMVRKEGLKSGHWGVFIKFGIQGANIGMTPEEVTPAAIIPVLELGLQKFDAPNRLTVDASKINGRKSATKRGTRKR